jgi:hypothetical protein
LIFPQPDATIKPNFNTEEFVSIKTFGTCALAVTNLLFAENFAVTGTISRADNTPVQGLVVVLENGGSPIAQFTTDAAGSYAFSVPAGAYTQLRVRNTGAVIAKLPKTVEHTAATNMTISKDTSIDIKMPAYVRMYGAVLSSTGDTIKKAQVEAKRWLGYQQTPWDQTISDSVNGGYEIFQESGGVKIWITPPSGLGVNDAAFEYTLTKDTLLNLILPKSLILSGIVTNFRGDTLNGIGVTIEAGGGSQIDSSTNTSGAYTIPLNPGAYNIRLRNSQKDLPGTPRTLEATVATSISLTKDTSINLKLPYYATVRCSVVTSTGVPVSQAALISKRWLGYEQPPWDWDSTDANGRSTLIMGTDSNKIWITPSPGSDLFAATVIVRSPRDTNLTITLPAGAALSGVVYRADSTPVPGITIALQIDADQIQTQTDGAGRYSIKLQPATYRLRVRNTNTPIAGIPQSLEYSVNDTLTLSANRVMDIRLPLFPVITGIIKDPAGNPLSGVQILAKRWLGYEQPPWAIYTTASDGLFTLTVGAGINKVWITPPAEGLLGAFNFIESFDSSKVKDIYIATKAQGIKRIRPSVVSTGQSGNITIIGINSNFAGVPALNLGDDITVSNIKVISSITLTADITVAADARTGNRDALVTMTGSTIVGPSVLTITPPASDTLELDNQGKTIGAIVIADGTGTELMIPAGTPVALPPGSDSVVSFLAPIIKATDVKPTTGEFTDVQRELGPTGLTFGDTVIMTSTYKNQDIDGLNEATLQPLYFIDKTGSTSSASVGDSMPIIKRDTAANSISFTIAHFSMFRLASKNASATVQFPKALHSLRTDLLTPQTMFRRQIALNFSIAARDAHQSISLKVFDLRGKTVARLIDGITGEGTHTVLWNSSSSANGTYICRLTIGTVAVQKEIVLIH